MATKLTGLIIASTNEVVLKVIPGHVIYMYQVLDLIKFKIILITLHIQNALNRAMILFSQKKRTYVYCNRPFLLTGNILYRGTFDKL